MNRATVIISKRLLLILWITTELGFSFTLSNFNLKNPLQLLVLSNKNRRKLTSTLLWNSNSQANNDNTSSEVGEEETNRPRKTKYVLGPQFQDQTDVEEMDLYWGCAFDSTNTVNKVSTVGDGSDNSSGNNDAQVDDASTNVNKNTKPQEEERTGAVSSGRYDLGIGKNDPFEYTVETPDDSKKMVANDAESQYLSRALWLYKGDSKVEKESNQGLEINEKEIHEPSQSTLRYEDIDQSIPLSVFDPEGGVDLIWDLLRNDALREAQREPLLVSFLYSSILNHPNLESAIAFHLANRLASPSMISTQIMSLILEALYESPTFRKYLRADLIAVRDRDPACTCLPDVFLHYKGFHALQSQRVAHYLWRKGNRRTLAHFFQSQMSQHFQIDIHPNATLGSGIMLDHGTGLVIGETASVGHNCSILHHVTLGGSGKRGLDRHPKIGNGVLLGAGASVLGNIRVGDGCQVGAGTLVIGDLPEHSVCVGVPGRIIGTYKNVAQPSQTMNQVGSEGSDEMISYYQSDGI